MMNEGRLDNLSEVGFVRVSQQNGLVWLFSKNQHGRREERLKSIKCEAYYIISECACATLSTIQRNDGFGPLVMRIQFWTGISFHADAVGLVHFMPVDWTVSLWSTAWRGAMGCTTSGSTET